mgnify:CR=1 FL=1
MSAAPRREDAIDLPQCVVTSFGYRHGPAPEATIVVDVRDLLRDPNVDPAVRELDGFDARVRQRVLATPGALALIDHTVLLVQGVLTEAPGAVVDVAVGCAGGRHRSVALAERIAEALDQYGVVVELEHRDVHRPVLP